MILIIALIVVVAFIVYFSVDGKKKVKSLVDGKYYKVLPDTKELMTETADALATIHQRIEILIKHLKKKGASDRLGEMLHSKYSQDIISEAVIQSGYTSYTVDKKDIHMCIRSRDEARKVYDINTLMYVIIHELAHLISTEIGHTAKFKSIFKYLINEGISAGIYNYVDYSKTPVNYCGMILTTSIANG